MVLFVDIGKGTQDILVPRKGLNPENWVKAILPSPTSKFASLIENSKRDLKIDGMVMGGGPLKKALVNHLKRGYKVVLSERFARTIRDDLEKVKELGFEVKENLESPDFFFKDLEFELYEELLKMAGLDRNFSFLGVACQDHGFVKGQSDRVTRFKLFEKFLSRSRNPLEFFFTSKTGIFSRFDSILEQLKIYGVEGFVVDSKIASICGIMAYAEELGVDEFVGLDIGNGHTLGVSIRGGLVGGIFEHHTKMVNADKLRLLVKKLISGKLTFEEVYEDGGHGDLIFEPVKAERIFITGPNRFLFKEYGEYVYPFGDVMITGCVGLFKIYHKILQV